MLYTLSIQRDAVNGDISFLKRLVSHAKKGENYEI